MQAFHPWLVQAIAKKWCDEMFWGSLIAMGLASGPRKSAVLYQASDAAFVTGGRDGNARTKRRSHKRAVNSLGCNEFPGPLRPIICPYRSPTSSHARRSLTADPIPRSKHSSHMTSIGFPLGQHWPDERAILLTSAIATSMRGLQANVPCSQVPTGAPLNLGRIAHDDHSAEVQ